MIHLSANLGFLWTELPLTARIRAAEKAGFDAVECHFPYDTPTSEVVAALQETKLSMLALNTSPGNVTAGDLGLAAVPGREVEAKGLIDQAVAYAVAINAKSIHVMAGKSDGIPDAKAVFLENLQYAVSLAEQYDLTILIEPLNHRDAPGYFLRTLEDAIALLDILAAARLKVMFDCYHMQIEGGDLLARFKTHVARIGHVQFASVPNRTEPDQGEVNFNWVLPALQDAGYDGAFGAEYRPIGTTEDGLGWMQAFRP